MMKSWISLAAVAVLGMGLTACSNNKEVVSVSSPQETPVNTSASG